jgi:hypothetical protein
MRGTWVGWRWLGTVLLVVAGCWTTQPEIKPKPHPEEYIVPPPDDPRFSSPVSFPKEAQRDLQLKKNTTDMPGPHPNGPQFGSGPGMGRY